MFRRKSLTTNIMRGIGWLVSTTARRIRKPVAPSTISGFQPVITTGISLRTMLKLALGQLPGVRNRALLTMR
jgi:hypothetical protein